MLIILYMYIILCTCINLVYPPYLVGLSFWKANSRKVFAIPVTAIKKEHTVVCIEDEILCIQMIWRLPMNILSNQVLYIIHHCKITTATV